MKTIMQSSESTSKALLVMERWEDDNQFEIASDKKIEKHLCLNTAGMKIKDMLGRLVNDADCVAYCGFKFKPLQVYFLAFFDYADTNLQVVFYLTPKQHEFIKKALRAKLLKSGASVYFLNNDRFVGINFAEGERLLSKDQVLDLLATNPVYPPKHPQKQPKT